VSATNEIAALTDAELERLVRDLGRVVSKLKVYLRELLRRADVDEDGGLEETRANAALARRLAVDLAGALEQAGYDDAVERVRKAFDRVTDAAEADLEDEVEDFTGVDVSGLTRFVDGTVNRMLALKDRAGERLREVLLLSVTSNLPLENAVAKLAEAARISLQDAVTEASTALMAYGRIAIVDHAEAAGYDLFEYDGPDDEIIREFCSRCVGKVYTRADLDEMNNGTRLKPVSEYLGGYHCRHGLRPVSIEEARAMPRSAIAGREAKAIVFRRKQGPAAMKFAALGQREIRAKRRAA
jgi:hypothetical protein